MNGGVKMKVVSVSRCAILLLVSALLCTSAYCQSIGAEGLVDRFYGATEVQRAEIRGLYVGKSVSARGVINNVEESSFFNTEEDVRENYFTVKTLVQNTSAGNPYEVVFFYKDRKAVENFKKGERIEKCGKLLKIVDRGLWIYLWIEVE